MAQRGNDVATRDVTMVLLKEAFVSLTALRGKSSDVALRGVPIKS